MALTLAVWFVPAGVGIAEAAGWVPHGVAGPLAFLTMVASGAGLWAFCSGVAETSELGETAGWAHEDH